jgi:hypothetical protein
LVPAAAYRYSSDPEKVGFGIWIAAHCVLDDLGRAFELLDRRRAAQVLSHHRIGQI